MQVNNIIASNTIKNPSVFQADFLLQKFDIELYPVFYSLLELPVLTVKEHMI